MDQSIIRPKVLIDTEIMEKLEQCEPTALPVVSCFLDSLLTIQEEYVMQLSTEFLRVKETKSRYEHKIVFVEKK